MMSKWDVGIDNFIIWKGVIAMVFGVDIKASVSTYVGVFVRYYDYHRIDHIFD